MGTRGGTRALRTGVGAASRRDDTRTPAPSGARPEPVDPLRTAIARLVHEGTTGGSAAEAQADRVSGVSPGPAEPPGARPRTDPPGDTVSRRPHGLTDDGRRLPDAERRHFESRFGQDLGAVRVHTGDDAARLSHAHRARAFTHGSHIVFGADEFRPATASGRRLLAHELTHVVQQRGTGAVHTVQRTIGDGHDLRSRRFAGNEELENAYDPADPNVSAGARGLHVRILQQALLDAGQSLPAFGVDGKFEGETRTAVRGFQASQGLTGLQVDGIVGPITMGLLDAFFLDPAHDAATAISPTPSTPPTPNAPWARGSAPAELYAGTRTLTPEEIAAVERARSTEVQAPVGGPPPTFRPQIEKPPGSGIMVDYETRIRDRARQVIDDQYRRLGVPAARRMANPAAVYDWSLVHRIADAAAAQTDRVFGDYAVGDPMRHGVNLGDAFERKQNQYAAGGPGFEQGRVEWRVNKILEGPEMALINEEHGAVSSDSAVAGHLSAVRTHFTSDAAYRRKLILIDHGWPAFADPATRTVYLQRLQGATDAQNRRNLWNMFHTVIHEYVHTLAHPDYRSYAAALSERGGGKTYREGMTEYFTHMVISTISYDAALRATVEDTYNDPANPVAIPPYTGYAERHNAQAVIGVVGIRNAMAAFFLGEVQFIGGGP